MYKSVIVYFLLIFNLQVSSVIGQDLLADLDKVHKFYSRKDLFKSEMVIDIFHVSDLKSPYMSKKATVSKNYNTYYYKIDDTEMLMTDKLLLMIFNSQKRMVYRNISPKEFDEISRSMYSSSLDSTMSKYDSVAYMGITGNNKKYTIFTSKGIIRKTELSLHKDNFSIESLTYYYNSLLNKEIARVTVDFNNLSPAAEDQAIGLENFIVFKKSQVVPVGIYKGYSINIVNHEK